MKRVHVHEKEERNSGRHCPWKRYIPSLWNLAKPLEEKVEFSLHKQQWLYVFKKKGRKKKIGKPAA